MDEDATAESVTMDEDATTESQSVVDKKPMVGMEFSSLDEAFTFYNQYAKATGFSVRKGKTTHRKDTKEIMNKYFVCGKEGTSLLTGTQRFHAMGRENCNAKLVLLKKRNNINWIITKFVDEHSHGLTTPKRIGFLRSHREVSAAKKQLTMELSEVNIPNYKQVALYGVQSEGIQNMGTKTDIHNYRQDLRKEVNGHDVQLLDEHFKYQKSKNPSFSYNFDSTEDNVLDKCFWEDADSDIIVDDFGSTIHDETDSSLLVHKSKLLKLASQLIDLALVSDTATEFLYQCFENTLEVVQKIVDKSGISNSVVGSTSLGGESTTYKDPTPVRGTGPIKRFKGGKEIAMERSKRRCTLCGKTGHDKRKCTPTGERSQGKEDLQDEQSMKEQNVP